MRSCLVIFLENIDAVRICAAVWWEAWGVDQRDIEMNEVINIEEKFSLFSDYLSPKRIEKLNGQQIILAKLKGEFVFHKHDHEDELFMVIKGQLILELKDETVVVNPGEFYTVPRGVEHKPTAKE